MGLFMRFKTKSQIIIFIKREGEDFADLVREAYNRHPLADGRIRRSGTFRDLLVAFKSVPKDVLEDVVNGVVLGEEEDEELEAEMDDYEDEEEDADADDSEDDDYVAEGV